MEKIATNIKFVLETKGKKDIVNSNLKIYKVYNNDVVEIEAVKEYFNIKDIFEGVVLDAENNIHILCELSSFGNTEVFLETPTKKRIVGALKKRMIGSANSTYGYNKYPTTPNKQDIEELKKLLEGIKEGLNYFKEESKHSSKEEFYLV